MHIKNKKGQSTVEYVLLMTAVVVVIIAFVSSSNPHGFQAQLNLTLNQVTNDMNSEADQLVQSHIPPAGGAVAVPTLITVSVCGGANQPVCAGAK